MQVIPAIDIRQGRCVRLYQGDYSNETVYSADPAAVARSWESQGASRIHVVDLDGAAGGEPQNLDTVKAILRSVNVPVQLGGGIRKTGTAEAMLDMGVDRVVLGTAAVEKPELLAELCARFLERIVVGIDARDGLVASHGWTQKSAIGAVEMAERVVSLGARRIVYTDISRDGTLTSPNFAALAELQSHIAVPIIASGGVSTLDHVRRLVDMRVEGAIIGKALYAGELKLADALAAAEKEKSMPHTHKFEVSKIDLLDSPERMKGLPSFETVFAALPIKATDRIADIGCGTGVFSVPLSRKVPQGKVFCLDIADEMLDRVRKKIKENNIPNIEARRCTEMDFGLPASSLDGAFMTFVFHEQEDRVAFLKAVRDLLKPNGWVGIVEWVKKEMPMGPPLRERIDPAEAGEIASKAGLKVLLDKPLGEKHYMIVLSR